MVRGALGSRWRKAVEVGDCLEKRCVIRPSSYPVRRFKQLCSKLLAIKDFVVGNLILVTKVAVQTLKMWGTSSSKMVITIY
jgi:hypothetical protein